MTTRTEYVGLWECGFQAFLVQPFSVGHRGDEKWVLTTLNGDANVFAKLPEDDEAAQVVTVDEGPNGPICHATRTYHGWVSSELEFDCSLMCSLGDIQGPIFEWADTKVVSEEVSAEEVEKFQRKLEMEQALQRDRVLREAARQKAKMDRARKQNGSIRAGSKTGQEWRYKDRSSRN